MNRTIYALLIAVSFSCAPVALAEDIPAFDKEAFMRAASVTKTLRITMTDCVLMAFKNNSDILVKQITPVIADQNAHVQRAVFEPDFTFDFTMDDDTKLNDAPLFYPNPSKTRTGTFDFGYDQKLVTGTQLELDFFNKRTRSNDRPDVASMQPAFDSEARITITQPLLKGFGITVNKAFWLIAKNNKLISVQDFTKDVMKILTDVKKNYYEYQYAQEQYKVAVASLERVERLHNINKEKYAKGLASNVDLLESESEVAKTEQGLLGAEFDMKAAEDDLKYVTNLVDDEELWNADIELLDDLRYAKESPELIESVNKAFDHRPDYDAMKIDLKSKNISVIYYKNGVLPTVDLIGSYGLNGLGKNYEKDLGNIGGGKYQHWAIGVTVNFPMGFEKEKAEYEKSKLEKKRALIEFSRLEQRIILEVRNAVRDVDIKYRILLASEVSKKAEEENYTVQESRFRAGLISTLDMLIYYERLTKAQVNYIRSVIDYNISLIELSRVEGMTLVDENITIAAS